MTARLVRLEAPASGSRLDHLLVERVPGHSRNRLQTLIRQGRVTVNGVVVTKSGFRLEGGECVEILIPAPAPASVTPEAIPLDIVYEDRDVIIVNKPAGMVVHPSPGHEHGTLVNAALAHAPDIKGVGGELRPGVVHRLDKDTSGLVLMAKHDRALQAIQRQFQDRQVVKVYLGLVDGKPPTPNGRVEAAIGRDRQHRKRMEIVPDAKGRLAQTGYRTLETFPEHSLLELRPETGRTHQIRVHMSFLGCPIVGDRVYGRRRPTLAVSRHFLHALKLTLHLPHSPEAQTFEAPLPADLGEILVQLRKTK